MPWFAVYNLTSKELISAADDVAPDAFLASKNFGKVAIAGPPDFDQVYWDPATITFKPRSGIPDYITPFATKAQARAVAKTLLEKDPATWTENQKTQCLALLLAIAVIDLRSGNF